MLAVSVLRLQLQALPELNLLLWLDFGSAYRTDVVILEPFLDAFSVEEVVPVVRQRRDAVLSVVELLHANATLIDARPVELPAEFTMY